jgi:hypothetical protein
VHELEINLEALPSEDSEGQREHYVYYKTYLVATRFQTLKSVLAQSQNWDCITAI